MVDLALDKPFIFSLKLVLRELVHLIRLTRHYRYLKSEHPLTMRIQLSIHFGINIPKCIDKEI